MTKSKAKSLIKQRSTWIASMLACFAFLIMAIKVYRVSMSTIATHLWVMLIGLLLIIVVAWLLGWLASLLRGRRK